MRQHRDSDGGSTRNSAATSLRTPADLDVAVLERQCQEELGSLAEFWLKRLPDDADARLLEDLRTLLPLASRPSA